MQGSAEAHARVSSLESKLKVVVAEVDSMQEQAALTARLQVSTAGLAQPSLALPQAATDILYRCCPASVSAPALEDLAVGLWPDEPSMLVQLPSSSTAPRVLSLLFPPSCGFMGAVLACRTSTRI